MKTLLSSFVVTLVLTVSSLAAADQCQWTTAQQAEDAARLLSLFPGQYIDYCEPCGGEKAFVPFERVTVESTGYEDYFTVKVNGQEIDLAYVFVRTGKSTFANLSKLVGCPSQDVSSFITAEVAADEPASEDKADSISGDTPTAGTGCAVADGSAGAGWALLLLGLALLRRRVRS